MTQGYAVVGPENISGLNLASGQVVQVSGNVVQISGQAVSVSGNVVQISGNVVQISGQAVSVSGNVVQISGQAVSVSGNLISVTGTVATSMSGNVVQAWNYGQPTYTLVVDTISGAVGRGMVGFYNPGGKSQYITKIYVAFVSGINNRTISWQLIRYSGLVTGTALAPVPYDTLDSASIVSGFTIVSSTVTPVVMDSFSCYADGATSPPTAPIERVYGRTVGQKAVVVRSGQSVMLKQMSGALTVPYPVTMVWEEY